MELVKTKLRGFDPRVNSADRATAACWRSSTNFCGYMVSRGQRNVFPRSLISVFEIGAATFHFRQSRMNTYISWEGKYYPINPLLLTPVNHTRCLELVRDSSPRVASLPNILEEIWYYYTYSSVR
jgi:hypothetical protein